MRRLTVARQAERDIDNLLRQSAAQFGAAAAERYRRLIDIAFNALLEDPRRPGVRALQEVSPGMFLYPLRHSRTQVPPADRIGRPRHVVVFTVDPERLQIIRLLHDSMDAPRQFVEDS